MALETGTYIDDLNASNPASTDGLGQADDHMRLIKATVKNTFPNISNAVTSSHGELNIVDGSTSRVNATIVDGDGIVMNDGGTMKQVNASSLKTYMSIPTSLTDLGISDGSNGQFLKTNGSGSFSFADPADVDNYVNSLSWNTGNGVLTVGRTGSLSDLTVDLDGRYLTTHPSISQAADTSNSGTTVLQNIGMDSNGHVTSHSSKSLAGIGAPKAVYTGTSTASMAINNVLAGDVIVAWLGQYATSNTSELVKIWDQSGWVGFNPSSTTLAGGSGSNIRWENTTGSTKNIYIQFSNSTTGFTGRTVAFHYG